MRNAVDCTPIWRTLRPSYFASGVLDSFLPGRRFRRCRHATDRGRGDRAVEGGSGGRAPGRSARRGVRETWCGSARVLSVPRRQDALARRDAFEESVALPGRVSARWHGDRLGDEGRRRVVPTCGGAAAERLSTDRRRGGGEAIHGAQTPDDAGKGCRGCEALGPG